MWKHLMMAVTTLQLVAGAANAAGYHPTETSYLCDTNDDNKAYGSSWVNVAPPNHGKLIGLKITAFEEAYEYPCNNGGVIINTLPLGNLKSISFLANGDLGTNNGPGAYIQIVGSDGVNYSTPIATGVKSTSTAGWYQVSYTLDELTTSAGVPAGVSIITFGILEHIPTNGPAAAHTTLIADMYINGIAAVPDLRAGTVATCPFQTCNQ